MRRGGGEGKGGGEGERASQQPEYLVSFNHQIASNECGDVSYIYDITSTTGSGYRPNGKHLGRYEHSASILSPEDETMRLDSAEYGNLLVYGGRDRIKRFWRAVKPSEQFRLCFCASLYI